MISKELRSALVLNHIPFLGVLIFAVFYGYAASLYPGGSQADSNFIGFDWVHNYWCNLMNKTAMNGSNNPGRPYAIISLIILCGSLAIFFYQFSEFVAQNNFWKKAIKWGGGASMFFGTFIFTSYHDLMTIVSSFFGIFVVLGIILTLYKSKLEFYKLTGAICLVVLAINNLIYYSGWLIEWLPLVQKISFLFVLVWVLGLNRVVRKKIID